jgi:hypothetical protein
LPKEIKKILKGAVKDYVDPPTKHLNDWQWRQLQSVQRDVPVTEVPDYIQKGFGEFMSEQAKRAAAGDLTARDLLKAYLITQSSIGRQGLSYNTATKAGLKVPKTDELVRPEGAFATWLGSKSGQKYLDAAMKGELDKQALAEIQAKFAPFGKQNALGQSMEYAANVAPKMAADLNKAITGTADEYRDYAEQLKGIAGSKSGFIGSMLGRGDLPTFDARQIYLHTAGEPLPTATPSSVLNRGKGFGGREAVDRLAARQAAMGLAIDPSLDPFYQHLTHHTIWDKIGNDQTTHQDLIEAMKNYKAGGPVHMKDGSSIFDQPSTEELKQASKAAYGKQRMFGMTRPEQAAEPQDLATLSSYNPTLRQSIAKGIKSGLQYLGAPSSQARNVSHLLTEPAANPTGFVSPLDFVPVLGTAVGLQEGLQNAKESMEQGDKVGALIDLAVGVAPGSFSTIAAAPATGRALKRGVQAGERYAERTLPEIMERGGPLADALSGLTKGSRSQIFIGPSAATWDAAAAKKAYGMERAGKTPLEIWKETGTFKAADGNWRQEISDVGSRFNEPKDIKEKAAAKKQQELLNRERIYESSLHPDLFPTRLAEAQKELRNQNKQLRFERQRPLGLEANPETQGNLARIALEHPALYEAYPTLANIPVYQVNKPLPGGASANMVVTRGARESATGNYLPEVKNISLSRVRRPSQARNYRSDTLHELQHAVQTIEDWAPGGSVNPNNPAAIEIYERLKNAQPAGSERLTDERLRQMAAREAYERMAGEAESRATEARKDLTAAERREILPTVTYATDVPLERQIVQQPFRFEAPATSTPALDAMRMKEWDGKVEGMKEGGKKIVKSVVSSAIQLPQSQSRGLSATEKQALRSMGLGVPGVDFSDVMDPAQKMRFSELLGNIGAEGKYLNITQSDRSRVFGPNKGGVGFSGLQLTSVPHKEAGSVWGLGKEAHATRMINANTPDTVWTTFIGSPTQHMSNPVTVQRMLEAHRKAGASPELEAKMNERLRAAVNPKTGKPIFDPSIDVADPKVMDALDTFDRRKAFAEVLSGKGVGGPKKGGSVIDAASIIQEETDPLLFGAPTYAVGPRVFELNNTKFYRPDLNEAFPWQVGGTDYGLHAEPVPLELAAPTIVNRLATRIDKRGRLMPVTHKDLTANTPRELISHEYLMNLSNEGYKHGGEVHMADGGITSDDLIVEEKAL